MSRPDRSAAPPRAGKSRPLVVLNVNGDAATRSSLSHVLSGAGFTVVEAATGEAALRAVAAERPDLVLLDLQLPDLSGLEVCRRIKGNQQTATVLVIQISAAFTSSDCRVEGLDSGADCCIAQPVAPDELVATVRAVLRTRRSEEAERKAALRLSRTFETIQDALLLLDAHGQIEEFNGAAARLLGGDLSELAGQSCVAALSGIVPADAMEALLARARLGRQEIESQCGEQFYRLSAYPVHGDDGGIDGSVLLIADTSYRKQLEGQLHARMQELAESSRRTDEFLGMLAHELRNPLHAISAAANVLADEGGSSARPRDVIQRQLSVLARLVDDLLEVSRMTRGTLSLRKRTIDLAQVVRQAAQASRAVLDRRSQQLALKLPDESESFVIEGDDLRLEQVFMNLLANAAKFSEPSRTIELELRERWDGEQRLAEVVVRDQGVGVPRDMLTKIFDPFVQVDQSLARSLGGLGIGLSMARSLVELHGGSIFAKSEGVGKGSEFAVLLPASASPQPLESSAARSSAPPTAREGEASSRPLRVLVVEDNEDTLELVQMWVRNLGHEVQGASDGRSGLEAAVTMKPEVALIDIGLPGLDGYEIARNVRESEGGESIYMVAVTGYGRPEDRARALDAGFDAHVVKPLDMAALKRALEQRNVEQRKSQRGRRADASPNGS